LVLVIWGLSGFSDCIFRCSLVSCDLVLPGPAARRKVVDIGLMQAIDGRTERHAILTADMLF
jgi:hypothetical protein